MDWDGLAVFLQEIRAYLVNSLGHPGVQRDSTVDNLIDKCEFYISTTLHLRLQDEVDNNNTGGTYLNMATKSGNKGGGGGLRLEINKGKLLIKLL